MAEANTKKPKTAPGIRVRTAQAGFRRGGREWSGTTDVPVSEFTKPQLEQIRAEPLLVVEDIDIAIESADAE
ncbi:MAG: HI1506-related protein [Methylobacter sp.]|uniref:HI1506-related protein n=1 Tax=Methylobacter sp. TaxID=2051955 RepID=UPI002589A941|nr:HI1506-related protein [Methylobacter sp.]MCL7422523.1 HI1506-related protein [Methylobacter sp.]